MRTDSPVPSSHADLLDLTVRRLPAADPGVCCIAGRVLLRHPIAVGWQAWAEPAKLASWFVEEAEGDVAPDATVVWRWKQVGVEFALRVIACEPPRRLVLSGPLPGAAERIEVELQDVGDATWLELKHYAGNAPEGESGHRFARELASGWTMALAQLQHWLDHAGGAPKQEWLSLRTTSADWRRVADLYRSHGGAILSRLTRGGGILADSGSELLLEWPEISGLVECKNFQGSDGDARTVGLRVSSWQSLPEARQASVRSAVEAAVSELEAALR